MVNFVLFLFLTSLHSLTTQQINNISVDFDGFKYKNVPKEYYDDRGNAEINKQYTASDQGSYDLSVEIKDGSKERAVINTQLINQRLKQHRTLLLPNLVIYIDDGGVDIEGNRTLIFQPNTELRIVPNNKERYEILKIHDVENVVLVNPKIRGDRLEHVGNKGEWGMGIAVRSSKNIHIYNARVSHCWGDGIYIGQTKPTHSPSERVFIYDPILDYNRRNGISITSVIHLEVRKPLVSNTFGVLPMCGIDIEPGNEREIVKDVSIIDPITFNNAKGGIVVNLSKLSEIENSYSSVKIMNHIDDASNVGFYISGINTAKRKGNRLNGDITVVNSQLKNNKTPLNIGQNVHLLPKIVLDKIDIQKRGSNALNSIQKRIGNVENVIIK